jgi:hypothetical protein
MHEEFLQSALATFRSQKRQVERAIGQLTDDQMHARLDERTNCIAVIMKHLAGNMRSRWTDFLTTDGEKPWRARDGEFVDDLKSRDDLMQRWEQGWALVFEQLGRLTTDDLTRTVHTRGHPTSVIRTICGHIAHYGYHVGQSLLLACHLAGGKWQWLTIPPGQSEQHNQRVWGR